MSSRSKIESLLFASEHPQTVDEIARLTRLDTREVAQVIAHLQREYSDNARGIQIIFNGHTAEMTTAGENADLVSELVSHEKASMTQAKIETLTVLAYQGPLTKPELESIRGVNCSLILRNLAIDNLIDEIKEQETTRYQASTQFLKILGIPSLQDLPNYQELSQKIPQTPSTELS